MTIKIMQTLVHYFSLLSILLIASCSDRPRLSTSLIAGRITTKISSPVTVAQQLQSEVVQYYQHPRITIILIPQADVQQSITALKKGGGTLLYDPNNGYGTDIPFYIAHLTPDQINNTQFIVGLNLRSALIDERPNYAQVLEEVATENEFNTPSSFIPLDSVAIKSLGDQQNLGKEVTVAVIDTGIDASHPAFNGRVVYWYDGTEETKTPLQAVSLNENGEFTFTHPADQTDSKTVTIPESLREREVFYAVMDEKKFYGQLGGHGNHRKSSNKKTDYLDLNENGASDHYLVVVAKSEAETVALFDVNGNLQLDEGPELVPIVDYNITTPTNRNEGMASFPARTRLIQYPLLISSTDEGLFLELGIPNGMHGTHVAAIVGANWRKGNLLGAAPQVNLMSLRVCSGISCTNSAIIRGLYQAFYNGKHIPDVVNISLGSHEQYYKDPLNYLIDDLSAKFGTIFFISAANNGPGLRTLNAFGNTGAAVMVGANVSKQTLHQQYNLPSGSNTAVENLLFFSSLGPSYTGEMKPHIVAPGGAISAVLAKDGLMGHANGTSMSSPLAAGTMAAVLGKLKENQHPSMQKIAQLRTSKQRGEQISQGTLLKYVYAMKDALAQAATDLPQLTRAQQGYGLIHAGNTLQALGTILTAVEDGQRDYFEVVINQGKKGGYNRRNNPLKTQRFQLSLGQDGERPLEELTEIIKNGVDVVLDRVEILNHRGEVQRNTYSSGGQRYFSILEQGNSKEGVARTHVSFNNRRKESFFSQRNVAEMLPGHTYIAHYKILYRSGNVQNILDVAQIPYQLKQQDVQVPAIDPSLQSTLMGIFHQDVPITINQFHRYPIAVTKNHATLNVKLALKPNTDGLLYIQVYNPHGKKVFSSRTGNSPHVEYKQVNISLSTVDHEENNEKNKGVIQTGVWEVTVSSSSSTWLSEASYDILVQAISFGPNLEEVKLKWGGKTHLAVQVPEGTTMQFTMGEIKQVRRDQVEVKAHHMSFHPLKLPAAEKLVSISVIDDQNLWWGQVDHRPFKKVGNSFHPVDKGYQFKKGSFTFSSPPQEQYYYAVDTILNFSQDNMSRKPVTTILAELQYGTALKSLKLKVTEKKLNYLGGSLLTISAPPAGVLNNPPKAVRMPLTITNGKQSWTVSVLVNSDQ